MAFLAILGVFIIIIGLVITGILFFIIRRNEEKKMDKNKDILDSYT